MLQRAGALLQGVVDTILPPACLGCRQPVSGMGNLCADCFSDVTFISDPLCTICGLPFQTTVAPDTLCGDCIARRPVFSQARSATIYGGKTRDIILALKHGDRTDMAPYLARWLHRAGHHHHIRTPACQPPEGAEIQSGGSAGDGPWSPGRMPGDQRSDHP